MWRWALVLIVAGCATNKPDICKRIVPPYASCDRDAECGDGYFCSQIPRFESGGICTVRCATAASCPPAPSSLPATCAQDGAGQLVCTPDSYDIEACNPDDGLPP